MVDPIVILAAPRSGSSMTAGIFSQHGVWTGRCREGSPHNPKGYFENLDVKQFLVDHFGKLEAAAKKLCYSYKFEDMVLALEPTDPWLVKHSALYWEVWSDFNPKFLFVRRDPESVFQSNKDCGFGTSREIIELHGKVMDTVEKRHGGCNIYTDSLVQGDYTSLEEAFAYCEIDFDPQIAEDFINPNFWRHHAK